MTDALSRLMAALSDRYTIERELGAGGMATVYLAQDLKLHRKVALKVLRPELASALGPDRFLQEIDIAAKLNHPHILGLFDCGESDGFLYYVMPYIEGQSLRDRIAEEGELPIAEAVRILRDVVEALKHAHKHNVVHRDIKPDNVMLAEDHALVTDFGVAKAVSDATGAIGLTTEGVALGTPAYMAPEQAVADPHIDHRADFYAVGVIAYELLTGRTPFVGNTQQELLAAHVTQTPEPVTKYRESVPPALAELVMKCLEKKPADRWQTAEELLPQLEVLATPSGGVTPTGMVPVGRKVNRMWMMVAGAVVVAAIIVAIAFGNNRNSDGLVALDPNHVVVAVFRNATGDPSLDHVGERAAHWITQGLQQAAIRVAPWDMALQSWRYVQSEVEEGRVRDPVRLLAQETGAGTVVSGVLYLENDSLEVHANVTDAARNQPVGTVDPVKGPRESAGEVIADVQQAVMGFLALAFDERASTHTLRSARAPSYEAYRAFDEGLTHYHAGDYAAAIPHFHLAFQLDTSFVTPLIYAAINHRNIGHRAQSDSVVQILDRFREDLSEYDRHWLDYSKARDVGDNMEALRAIRLAAELAPGSRAVFNRAYIATEFLDRPQEAVDALLSLDPDRGPMRGWRSYFHRLGRAYRVLGQYGAALEVAREYRLRHGENVLTLRDEALALAGLGRVDEVSKLAQDISNLPEGHIPLRTQLPQGYWLSRIAVYLRWHRHHDAAMETIERAIQWYDMRSVETKRTRTWRFQYARALFVADRCDEALELLKSLNREFPGNRGFLGVMGMTMACIGNREDALEVSRLLAGLEIPYELGSISAYRSAIAGALGDVDAAVMLWRQASAEGFPRIPGYGDVRRISFERIRDHSEFQELIRPKG